MRRPVTILLLGLLALAAARRLRERPASHARAAVDPRVMPVGMYAGQPPLPQQISSNTFDDRLDSMLGPAGFEQAGRETDPTGNYFGTDTVPAPVYPTGRVNRDIDLEMVDNEVPFHTQGPDTGL